MENHPKPIKELLFKTQIFVGDEAIHLLHDSYFQSKWVSLYEKSVVKSVFQGKSFVLPWFERNKNEFRAIVLAVFREDVLVGVLMLSQKIDDQGKVKNYRFEGAGTSHALYQTWLVLPEFSNMFWEIGIKSFFEKFPNSYINLKSFPSVQFIETIRANPKFSRMMVIEEFYNPILDYKREDFIEILKKRHFKSKDNRLNRSGKVKFEKIDNLHSLDNAFDDIEVFYDLRQGAAFNKIPLGKGSNLRQLFLDWFKEGILHVTLLSLDGDLIGAVIVINDDYKTAHLAGLITFSPRHGKLSPGMVHLYNLAKLLHQEGFHDFKLSPGYDTYKERFSNSHEIIHEVMISNNPYELVKRKVRIKLRQTYLKYGKRPMEIDVYLSKTKAVLKNRVCYFFRKLSIKNRYQKQESITWAKNIVLQDLSQTQEYRRNDLRDLLLVKDFDLNISRWEFLDDALKRLEEKQSFITKVEKGKLLTCIWYKTNENGAYDFEQEIKIYTSLFFLKDETK